MPNIGNIFDTVGTALHLPEAGLSEMFGATQRANQPIQTIPSVQSQPSQMSNLQQGTWKQSATLNSKPQTLGATNGAAASSTPTFQSGASNAPAGANFSDIYNKYYQGWNRTAAEQDFAANPNKFAGQQQPSQDDTNRLIDEAYNSSYDYLNQAENTLRNDLPNVLQEAQNAYNTNLSQLTGQKTQALGTLDTNQTQATGRKENALAQARRIFDEQRMGAQQRFGGASSAGQAASELMGRQQLSEFGQTNRQFNDTVAQIEQQRASVEQNFQTGILQLEQQKQAAVSEANRTFQSKLLEIANNRAQLGQAKAQARLQALQDLRNQVFAIDQQNRQFQQALEMQKQQAQLQLQAYSTQASAASQAGTQAANSFNPNITSNLNPGAGLGQQQAAPQMTGQISQRRPDELIGQIGGMAGSFFDRLNPFN